MIETTNRRTFGLSASIPAGQFFPLPKLPLPRNTWGGGLIESRLVDRVTKKLVAETPKVDPVISEYGGLYLKIRFTVRFIEFVNQKYFLFQLLPDSLRLEYAVDVNKRLNDYSVVQIDPNESQVRETLSFYLDYQTFLLNYSNLDKLKTQGENLAPTYKTKLVQVDYLLGKTLTKLKRRKRKVLL